MRANGACTDKIQADFVGNLPCLGIEIKANFHVIGDESDRGDDYVRYACGATEPEMVTDIWFEPRLGRRATAALPDQLAIFAGRPHASAESARARSR